MTAAVSSMLTQFRLYAELAKGGIVTLVVISVCAGYLAAHPLEVPLQPARLVATLVAVLALSAAAAALNQLQERGIDARMARTARRPLPSGRLLPASARAFVLATGLLGLGMLAILDLRLLVLGLVALLSYNVLYTRWWKPRWAYAAIPGAIPGALPVWMGSLAANGDPWNAGGLYLFAVLFMWQMPHFWSLAIKYAGDYADGGIPTLPVARGTPTTRLQIALWALAYVGLATLAPLFLGVGALYLSASLAVSVKVLWELARYAREGESRGWLRFFLWVNFSLILYFAAAVIDHWSPYWLTPWLTR